MRCNVYWRQNMKENRRYFFYFISLKCESCTRKIWLVSTCTLIFVQGFRYVYVRNYFISLKFFSINNWLFFFCCYKINWLTNLESSIILELFSFHIHVFSILILLSDFHGKCLSRFLDTREIKMLNL